MWAPMLDSGRRCFHYVTRYFIYNTDLFTRFDFTARLSSSIFSQTGSSCATRTDKPLPDGRYHHEVFYTHTS